MVKVTWARSKSSKPSQKPSLQSHRNIQRAGFADFEPTGHAWILDTASEISKIALPFNSSKVFVNGYSVIHCINWCVFNLTLKSSLEKSVSNLPPFLYFSNTFFWTQTACYFCWRTLLGIGRHYLFSKPILEVSSRSMKHTVCMIHYMVMVISDQTVWVKLFDSWKSISKESPNSKKFSRM